MTERAAGRHAARRGPAGHRTGPAGRSPRCCSATAPATGSRPATSRRWPHYLPRNGVTVVRFEQPWRVAGRKVATPPATLDAGAAGRGRRGCGCATPLDRRRPVRRRPLGRALRQRARGVAAAWRWRSRCTRRARPRSRGSTSCDGAGVPTLVVQGSGTHGPARRSSRADLDLSVVPGADHGFGCRRAAPVSQDGGDGDRRGGGAGVDRPRGRRGIDAGPWLVPPIVLAVLERPDRRRTLGDDD